MIQRFVIKETSSYLHPHNYFTNEPNLKNINNGFCVGAAAATQFITYPEAEKDLEEKEVKGGIYQIEKIYIKVDY